MIDLMAIARTEADGGDLLGLLGGLFESSAVRPEGYPDAGMVRCARRLVGYCDQRERALARGSRQSPPH